MQRLAGARHPQLQFVERLKAFVIERYGGIEKARDLARHYVEKAQSHLDLFKPSLEKESLLGLAEYAIRRDE